MIPFPLTCVSSDFTMQAAMLLHVLSSSTASSTTTTTATAAADAVMQCSCSFRSSLAAAVGYIATPARSTHLKRFRSLLFCGLSTCGS